MFLLFGKRQSYRIEMLGAEWAMQCARLHAEAFAYPWDSAEFEKLLTSGNVLADGAIASSGVPELFAFVLSRCAADEAEILTIATARSCRRRGLGRELLGRHLDALSIRRIARVFLEVGEDNASALGLYHALGFEKIGERPGYYRGEDRRVDALILKRDL